MSYSDPFEAASAARNDTLRSLEHIRTLNRAINTIDNISALRRDRYASSSTSPYLPSSPTAYSPYAGGGATGSTSYGSSSRRRDYGRSSSRDRHYSSRPSTPRSSHRRRPSRDDAYYASSGNPRPLTPHATYGGSPIRDSYSSRTDRVWGGGHGDSSRYPSTSSTTHRQSSDRNSEDWRSFSHFYTPRDPSPTPGRRN